MRLVNLLRNTFYALCSGMVVGLLTFIVRKAFVYYLPVELLGLEGLFTNVLSMLSLAEMGISTVISYGLYRELANKNNQEINMLMNIYRHVYFLIGCFVLVAGILIFFCLPFMIQDKSVPWEYVQFVYCIQVGIILSSYFLAYKRTLFTADQKDYMCIRIDIRCSVVNNLFKLFAVVILQSYILYAISSLFFNVLANFLISKEIDKEYPFLHSIRVTMSEMRERRFFKDVKNFLVHKISYVVYGSTDAIVVSSILGLRMSGLLANYVLIEQSVYKVLYKILQGIIPTVGNLVHDDDKEKIFHIYKVLDLLYFFIGGYVSCVYVLELQPFISLFFGNEFLLPTGYSIALAVNAFFAMQFENAYNFRSTYGVYENDRNYMIASAVVNLILSILLVYEFGIVGIMIGTLAGLAFILYGRVQFVFRLIFHRSMRPYLLGHLGKSILVAIEIGIIYKIFDWIALPKGYFTIGIESVLAAILMGLMQCTIFWHTEEFQEGWKYMRNIKMILQQKFKRQ